MTVDDLMGNLATLWPQSFPTAKSVEAWKAQYGLVLSPYEGRALGGAWKAVMETWSGPGRPPPAVFMAAIREAGDAF